MLIVIELKEKAKLTKVSFFTDIGFKKLFDFINENSRKS